MAVDRICIRCLVIVACFSAATCGGPTNDSSDPFSTPMAAPSTISSTQIDDVRTDRGPAEGEEASASVSPRSDHDGDESQPTSDATQSTPWATSDETTVVATDDQPYDWSATEAMASTEKSRQSEGDAFDADDDDDIEDVVDDDERRSSEPWPWMLLVLTGNTTLASRRQRDLATYVRLNLAARLDADYNDVVINRLVLMQATVVANISVEPSHLADGGGGGAGLEALGQGNVTLLELSGQEFLVDRIVRAEQLIDQRLLSTMDAAAAISVDSSELTVYGAVGSVFVLLFLALFVVLMFHGSCHTPEKYPHHGDAQLITDHTEEGVDTKQTGPFPPVIYTEQLAREMGDVVQLLDASRGRASGRTGNAGVWYDHVLNRHSGHSSVDYELTTPHDIGVKTIDLQLDEEHAVDGAECRVALDDYRQIEAAFQRMVRSSVDSSVLFL